MAEPKCPECSTGGKRHSVAEESDLASKDGDPWFEIVYCANAVMFMGSFQSSCLRAMFHPSRRFSKFFDTEREP